MTIRESQMLMYRDTSPTSGVPMPAMTDRQWQIKFSYMRSNTRPSKQRQLADTPWEHISHDAFGNKRYDGYSNWQTYCAFINDVLRQLRKSRTDFCYYTYQIQELLRFEPDCLQTKYFPEDQYWAVWLEL